MTSPSWEAFVREHFAGYLLPASAQAALSVEEAALFMERLTGRPHELALLRAVSTLSPRTEALHAFTSRVLPELVRALPSQTEVLRREWEGGFQGRLDLPPTLACWAAGQRAHFVTRARRRSFALPENVLVRAVAERLLQILTDLRQADALGNSGWGADAKGCEGQLRHLLASTVLRDVPREPIGPKHEEAAHASRHPCHAAALKWHRVLREGLDTSNPGVIARVVANGALSPLEDHTRFELAVVIRLLEALWARLTQAGDGRWSFRRCLVHKDRREVAAFERDDGASVRVYYNQSHLDAGPCDLGARHYFKSTGRMRPDATVVVERGKERSVAVVEIKLTEDAGYALQGFHEAMLYRWEYAAHLNGWPKAILVTSANVPGAVRGGDDVIAVSWNSWVPEEVAKGLLSGLAG